MKKIVCPSADHDGALLHHLFAASAGSFGVRLTWSLPVIVMRNTEQYPSRKLMNATLFPSGEIAGICAKLGAVSSVNDIAGPLPSAAMTPISMPLRKVIFVPSGDQLGYLPSFGGAVSRRTSLPSA